MRWDRNADIVVSCLACLDRGGTNLFGKEADLSDEDGIVVSVNYIEEVLVRPESISILTLLA